MTDRKVLETQEELQDRIETDQKYEEDVGSTFVQIKMGVKGQETKNQLLTRDPIYLDRRMKRVCRKRDRC